MAVVGASKVRLAARLLLRSWEADVLLCWHLGLLKLIPFLRRFRGRVCLYLHGIEAWRRLGFFSRRLLKCVDLFLSNSAFTWERFLEFHPECRGRPWQVVPLGCGDVDTHPSSPDTPPAALILGRMMRGEDYKGHRELIAAWPQVRAHVPQAQLWVVGDGDLRQELERVAASSNPAGAVRFLGRVPEDQKEELLRRCRCLAMPSRGEGFGLVYLEAMRLGRPCLVSTADAGREVVNPPEAGLAVDPGDPNALAEALCRLLADSDEWQVWSRSARRRYEERFTAQHFQRRLVQALFGSDQRGNL
jgi:phosphatidylinositol alpha-1,6-mannosyltransferase